MIKAIGCLIVIGVIISVIGAIISFIVAATGFLLQALLVIIGIAVVFAIFYGLFTAIKNAISVYRNIAEKARTR